MSDQLAEAHELLKQLEAITKEREALEAEAQRKLDQILEPIRFVYEEHLAATNELRTRLEEREALARAQVSEKVKALGATLKGETIQVVYIAPALSWDTKILLGYAAAHPELKDLGKMSDPRVQFRAVKNAKGGDQ